MSEPELTLLDGVRWHGAPVPGGRAHALLAALVLAAPRTVTATELVEEIWAEDEPGHPDKALQVLVSRVRSNTSPDVVHHQGNGYQIGLRPDQVDALRLRGQVRGAEAARSAGDLDVARHQARQAADVPVTTPPVDGPVAALVGEAREDQARARRLLGSVLLARGDAGEALPLLEDALARDPDDEARLAEVLRAESSVRGVPAALARYASYAERMRDSVGAEPGEELRRLHIDLLARDAPVREGLKYDAAPMVGRDDDVASIRGLLERSRVVSVVGAGGLGKTRMAHLVGRLAQQPVVYFVELAGVTTPEDVLPEVASVLGVRESVTSVRTAQLRADLRSRVAEQLSGPPTLLILDNCEHLVEAAADLVAFLVASTDSTSVLTTSRAPLGIAAEQVYLLPQLEDVDAVQLFEQRARAARSDVRLDAAEVAALITRLDGLPLAIELAAAKVRVMSVAEIGRRLEDRFALLAGRDRSAPDRHQTLEAVIAWSWNLLRAEDQSALQTLSVFPDGFSLDGAEAVLGGDALAPLAELVDQSLVVVREGDQVRYRFLETVREYGLKQLAAANGLDEARERLRAWAVDTARALTGRLFGLEQVATMGEVRAEVGNLTGVMRKALEERDVSTVVPLAGTLSGFWTIEGDHLGVHAICQPVLDLMVEQPPAPDQHLAEARGLLAALVVTAMIFSGSPPEDALRLQREIGLAGDNSRSDILARLILEVYADGSTASLEALDRLCDNPDPAMARGALQWATQVRENSGDLAGAIEASRRALQLSDNSDGPWTRALLDSQVSGLATQAGDWDVAVEHASRALPVMRALGAAEDAVQLRSILAFADIAHGRLEEAARVIEEIAADEHTHQTIGWSVTGITGEAELALARGDVDRGLQLYNECIRMATERGVGFAGASILLMPWVLFAEASALFAHVLHGRREEARPLAERVREKVPELLGESMPQLDFPVLGGVLLALGCWVLTGEPDATQRDAAVRLVALGQRFGYHRTLPTLAWTNVHSVVDAVVPGVLDGLVEEYAGQQAAGLRDEAQDAVAALG